MLSGSCRHRMCEGGQGSSMREAVTAGPPAQLSSDRSTWPARAYWGERTLRTQLLSLFILIELVAAAVAGAVTIFNARSATRVEIAASMELAELWVKEAVLLAQRETPADRFLADLSSQLRRVRHVRIEIRDAAGGLLEVRPAAVVPAPAAPQPSAWGVALGSAPPPAGVAAVVEAPTRRRGGAGGVGGVRIGALGG